jgi:hypothetical protein
MAQKEEAKYENNRGDNGVVTARKEAKKKGQQLQHARVCFQNARLRFQHKQD